MKDYFDSMLKKFILLPLSRIWEQCYKIRRMAYNYGYLKSYEYNIPIISVGNLTFGGTGKTPFTIWLAQYFNEKKLCPMILTRGYKGGLEHQSGLVLGSQKFRFNPVEFGDEAILIARKLNRGGVVVGKRRKENLENFFDKLSPDLILLDDGFQHLKLRRNLNIVLFDCLMPLSQYEVAPLGFLREGFSAIKDADVVILSRSDQATQSKIKLLKNLIQEKAGRKIPIVEIKYTPMGVFNCNYEEEYSASKLKGKKVICVAALASPESFFELIDSLGANIIDRIAYPDHYFFQKIDLENIVERSKKNDAIVVTSEKDIVKIRRISTDERIKYLDIKVEFQSGEDVFNELLNKKIQYIY